MSIKLSRRHYESKENYSIKIFGLSAPYFKNAPYVTGRRNTIDLEKQLSIKESSAETSAFARSKSLFKNVVTLQEALKAIEHPLRLHGGRIYRPALSARAESASSLGLGAASATVMQSVEEVNPTPTSFSEFGPDWTGQGASDASITIGGTYDGSQGSGTLTFKVTKGGTHGQELIKVGMYDPNDVFIEEIRIFKNDPVDEVYTASNGLTLVFGTGDFLKDDSFTVDVSDGNPSSYSPSSPTWLGTNVSDALVTFDGVYDGSNGSQTLTFEVVSGGVHGTDDLTVRVLDESQTQLETITISAQDPIDQQYTMANGLIFSLGAGTLYTGDTLTLGVSDSVGSVVDPSKTFDGTRNDNPNLEFGLTVTGGSFDVNGVSIDVYATDTMNIVIDRITQSAAGVTATFDEVTERVVLTQNSAGSAPTITLENDSSGFLAAAKLDTAVPVSGDDADTDKPLADVVQFSSVQSGTITINGNDITIDVSADSLSDVIDRINASDADVTASLNQSHQRISIVSDDITQSMVLESGDTGFFPALRITDGSYDPVSQAGIATSKRWMSIENAEIIADKIKEAANAFNALFSDKQGHSNTDGLLSALRSDLRSAVSAAFGSDYQKLRTTFGIHFDFSRSANRVFDLTYEDRSTLVSNLTKDGRPVNDLLFGSNSRRNDGLIEKVLNVLSTVESVLKTELGATGIFVNKHV